MSSITPFSSAYNAVVASNASKPARPAQEAKATSSSSQQDNDAANPLAATQAQSAAEAQQAAQVAAENAASFKKLTDAGITVKTVSFAGIYKDKVFSGVDTDGNNTVSESELSQQVLAGGGSQTQASELYKAMDMNGDGSVSKQEFEDSIQNPFSNPEFAKKVDNLISAIQAGTQAPSAIMDLYSNQGADSAQILGDLSKEFPA